MIRLTGLPAVFSFCGQGLVAVDREAVAVTAIGIAEWLSTTITSARSFHGIIIVQDRMRRDP